MWFTENNAIGRVDYAGNISQFGAINKAKLGSPQGITLGPDGKIWFADYGLGVGSVKPSGVVELFPLNPWVNLNRFSQTLNEPAPLLVVPDPNGHGIWFTDRWTGDLHNFTLSDAAPSYPVVVNDPDYDIGRPYALGLTTGPDGLIWYSDTYGRIRATRNYTSYRGPLSMTSTSMRPLTGR